MCQTSWTTGPLLVVCRCKPTLGLRSNVAPAQNHMCLDAVAQIFYCIGRLWQDLVAQPWSFSPCSSDGPLLTSWLPIVRQSSGGSEPPGPWPVGPWEFISPVTARITNTTTTAMWQLNPSPTSRTYSLNKRKHHRTNTNKHDVTRAADPQVTNRRESEAVLHTTCWYTLKLHSDMLYCTVWFCSRGINASGTQDSS